MKTDDLILHTDWIRTDSLRARWYENDQMWELTEMKEGRLHGDFKEWLSDGRLWWHDVYEKGELVKRIV